ncbi:MAG TPA: double-strand break repair protein AddB [Alphaproteobacteria bacterium]|nr:double-strand break repair protein AddB [Alphaproteobacteria bacterium]
MTEKRVANIAAGAPFVDALAAGIWNMAGRDDPLALTRVTVLLPTRRAIRSLREAFLRLGDGAPVLLPRLMPLGELDEEALLLEERANEGHADLPPAVPGLRRQLLLAQLVQKLGARNLAEAPDEAQAARLAEALARLLDEMQTERADPAKLKSLAPEAFARHWQQTLEFLAILTEHWPKILEAEGALDPAARRNAVLAAQAELWRAQPPAGPVIAAGSTGSIPATADLLDVIASLPQGQIVLPGLDRDMSEDCWRALLEEGGVPSHPQYGLARLLERLGVARSEVKDWTSSVAPASPPGRAKLFARALDPQDGEAARPAMSDLAAALDGVTRLDAPGPIEEAGAIALMMREAVEHEARTAALVTPDRGLARRVAAELRRWDIEVDDSAGQPLAATPAGAFARLALAMLAEDCAPAPLLAALKHPLSSGGEKTVVFRDKARALELAVLRGVRPAPGFAGLRSALVGEGEAALGSWLDGLAKAAAPLCDALAASAVAAEDLLRAHAAWLEHLAADDAMPGAARLWRGDDGEALANFFAEFAGAARDLPPMAGRAYPALIEALLAGRVVRPRYGAHPRLFIWGPLEARLQHAHLVILGGLNEGTWPADPGADPWMSRPMREAFGLPAPERRIGLAAHDVAQLFAAPQVALTRAERVDGTPTVPARWLQRLDNLLLGMDAGALPSGAKWLAWQQALDAPQAPPVPTPRPAPRPPVAARPRRLSVTEIETWMRDPYGIYAKHVLGLRALEPLDADPGAADRGSFIHDALDRFVKSWRPGETAEAAYERLLGFGREAFSSALDRPGVWAFWWPRFERIARWFAGNEIARRRESTPLAVEGWGEMKLPGPAGEFLLIAKADRIDSLGNGGLAVVDYKTGQPPGEKELTFGFSPQLPLEAMMAAAGAFKGVPPAEVSRIEFWRLSGGRPVAKISAHDAGLFATEAYRGLTGLIAAFDDPATPYLARPRAAHAPRFSDYEHLARVREWAASGEEGEEA